jgi:hypothetical protein
MMEKLIMSETENRILKKKLPMSLIIAAGYLVLSGALDLIWPLIGLGPHHAEFQAKSIAFKFGSQIREILFALLFLTSGIGLFLRKSWALKLALVMIIIGAVYSINSFAWGFAKGRPSLNVYLVSIAIVGLWNALWFYLVYRNKAELSVQNEIG